MELDLLSTIFDETQSKFPKLDPFDGKLSNFVFAPNKVLLKAEIWQMHFFPYY